MANLSSSIKISAIDDVTKPARTIAQALRDIETSEKAVAKGMAGTGATDKFVASLSKIKTTKADIEQVANAWKDYSKAAGLAAGSTTWTKEQIAGVKQWERQTIGALRTVKAEEARFYRAQNQAVAQHHKPGEYVGAAAAGIAGGMAAHKLYDAGKEAVVAGAERQHVRVGAMNAGIGPEELQRVEASAVEAKKNAPNLSVSEIMELHKEARSAVQHPEETFELIPELAKAASILKGMGAENANIADLVKGGESLGLMNDPARFHKYLEGQVKAMSVMGKTITTEQINEAAKYSKSAGATLSDEFLNTTMPSLIQEMHGSSAGDALSMLTKTFRGGLQNKHIPVQKMNELGLLAEPEKIKKNKAGQIMGYGGKVVGDDQLATDPRKWFNEIFKPAAEKAGYNTLSDQVRLLNQVLPQTAANLGRIFLQQEKTFGQHARNYAAAPGMDQSVENQRGDAKVGVDALKKSLEDLEAAVTGPMMPAIAGGLSSLTQGLGGLAAAAQQSPNFSATVAELGALGTAALALNAAPFAASMVGLEGLATALGTFAAAVTPAAAIIAAAAVALGLTNAMEDARKTPKEDGKTYTSDVLLGFSNALDRLMGGKGDVHPPDKFDAKKYAHEQEEKTWTPANVPTPTARPAEFGASQQTLAPKVDTSEVEGVKPKADEAKAGLDQLNQTVKPNVDNSDLRETISLAAQAESAIARLGGQLKWGIADANRKLQSLRSVQGGEFSTNGQQGQ